MDVFLRSTPIVAIRRSFSLYLKKHTTVVRITSAVFSTAFSPITPPVARAKSTVIASSCTPHRKARVVLVGSGRMGHIRASLLVGNPRFDFVGIVDKDPDAGRALGEEYGVESFESLDEVMDKKSRLDGIVISSPTSTHGSIIRNAADHKISVFTEKPVAETADHIQSIFDYSNAAGIALCCSFQRRFDPTYVAVTKMIQSGEIGTAVMASIFFADHPIAPKEFLLEGGNIFMDLSSHDVDYITHTLNDKVVSVYASGTSSDPDLAAAGVHDNATMVMNMQKGAVVTLFMSRSATYGYDQRCEIFGNKGLASVGNPPEHAAKLFNVNGISMSRLQHSFPQRFEKAFALELDTFANILLSLQQQQQQHEQKDNGSCKWPVTAEQCIHVQQVADAARLSCETGEVIRI